MAEIPRTTFSEVYDAFIQTCPGKTKAGRLSYAAVVITEWKREFSSQYPGAEEQIQRHTEILGDGYQTTNSGEAARLYLVREEGTDKVREVDGLRRRRENILVMGILANLIDRGYDETTIPEVILSFLNKNI